MSDIEKENGFDDKQHQHHVLMNTYSVMMRFNSRFTRKVTLGPDSMHDERYA
jgi:hypothetical protein